MSGDAHEQMGFSSLERAVVRTLVSELLDGAATLTTAEVFMAVCDLVVGHFSLTNAQLVTRIAGKSRAFAWSRPGVSPGGVSWAQKAAAIESASEPPAELEAASATVSDEKLGLSARLYVESHRALDGGDRTLLEEVLRRMLCLSSAPSTLKM